MSVEHFAYVMGRAMGAALHELLEGFWPATAAIVAEAMTPDIASPEPFAPNVPVADTDMDWFGWAEPAIKETLTEHEWLEYSWCWGCNCREEPMSGVDWIDHVAHEIAKVTACDPERAINALWNLQLKRAKQQ